MSSNLIIRPAAPDDYAQWLPLWDGYNAFYGRAGETALANEITAATWQRFFDAYEPMHALVAARDGALLGLGITICWIIMLVFAITRWRQAAL